MKSEFLAQEILQKMLEKDPANRPSFEECLEYDFFFQTSRKTDPITISFPRFTLPTQYVLNFDFLKIK